MPIYIEVYWKEIFILFISGNATLFAWSLWQNIFHYYMFGQWFVLRYELCLFYPCGLVLHLYPPPLLPFQLYLVVGSYAVLARYLYLRRNSQVPAPTPAWWMDRAGNLLLNEWWWWLQHFSCALFSTTLHHQFFRSLCRSRGGEHFIVESDYGQTYYRHRHHQHLNHNVFFVISPGQDCPLTSCSASCRYSSLQPAQFLSRNDFVCSSVNKWLVHFIPVRWNHLQKHRKYLIKRLPFQISWFGMV